MSSELLIDVSVPLYFQPGVYSARRDGHFVFIERAAPEHRYGRAIERVWRFDGGAADLRVETTSANVVDEVHFRVAQGALSSPAAAPPETAADVEAPVALAARWAGTIADGDESWAAEVSNGEPVGSWIWLGEHVLVGLDGDRQLAAVRVEGRTREVPVRELDFIAESEPYVDLDLTGDVLRVDIDFESDYGIDDDDDDDFENDHDVDEVVEAFREQMDAWFDGGDERPDRDSIDTGSGWVDTSCASSDGMFEIYEHEGCIQGFCMQAAPGEFAIDPAAAPSPAGERGIEVDLRAGVTCVWQPGRVADSYDVEVRVVGATPDRWIAWDNVRVGLAANRFAALHVLGAQQREPEEFDDDDDMWADGDSMAHMEEHFASRRWEDVSDIPAFPAFGISDWTGPVFGGPSPDGEDRYDGISLRYGDPFERERERDEIEVQLRDRVGAGEVYGMPGPDEDSMWIAHRLASDRMASIESEEEARRVFEETEQRAAEIAKMQWGTADVLIDGEPVSGRVLEIDDAWVVRLQHHGTYITIRGFRHPRSSVRLSALGSYRDFIDGSRALEAKQLDRMREARDENPDAFRGPSDDSRAISQVAEEFFEVLDGHAEGVCDMLVDGITDRHGGRDTYIRVLRIYQTAALYGGGGMSGDIRLSDDNRRASIPIHKDLPRAGGRTGGVATSVVFVGETPKYTEPSDDDVKLDGDTLTITLRLEKVDGEWKVATDLLGELVRVLGPPAEVVLPRG